MRTLFIHHIGHAKTGSSYLQSLFAINASLLAEEGIDYPMDETMADALRGRISTGNGHILVSRILTGSNSGETRGSVFFSSELLFPILIESGFEIFDPFWPRKRATIDPGERMERIVAWTKDQGFDRIRFLLFIRDPIAHALSQYHQKIKRGGSTETLAESFANYDVPARVAYFLEQADRFPGITVEIQNYSRVKRKLPRAAEHGLGLRTEVLTRKVEARVNRSMTVSELELIRHLNHSLGRKSGPLSDALCHQIPHLEMERFFPSLEVQRALWNRNREAIERINSRLPEDRRYRFDEAPPSRDQTQFTFSAEQLRVIAGTLGGRIAELDDQMTSWSSRQEIESRKKAKEIGELKKKISALKSDKKSAQKRLNQLEKRRKGRIGKLKSRIRKLLGLNRPREKSTLL